MSGYIGSKRSSSLVSATEITLDGAKLKSSGDSITKSDGTTAVLSESGGVVTLNNGTIGSGVVFPAGHIIQSVFSPTITNTDTGNKTSKTGVADVIGQITITSGNAVLIYVSAGLRATGGTQSFASMYVSKGTVASPSTDLANFAGGQSSSTYTNITCAGLVLDASPSSTTPDYVLQIRTDSGTTSSCALRFTDYRLAIHLFEVQL
jgi:hypothetical protein